MKAALMSLDTFLYGLGFGEIALLCHHVITTNNVTSNDIIAENGKEKFMIDII